MEPYTLCKFDINIYPKDFGKDKDPYIAEVTKIMNNEIYLIYMGDIPNMPGHCLVIGYETGKPYIAYHPECFIPILMEEL
jgi:hypothetical protein